MLTRKRKRDHELQQFQSGCCKFRKHPLLEWFHHTYQQSAVFQPLTSFPRPFLVYHDKKKIRMSNKLQDLLNSSNLYIIEHIYDVDHNNLYFMIQKDAQTLTYQLYQWNISSKNMNIHRIKIPGILEYTFDTLAFDSQRQWLIHYSINLNNCLLLTIRDVSQRHMPILYQIQLVFDYKGHTPSEMELPELELHFEPHTQTLFLYSCQCHWYEDFKNHVDDTELQSQYLCILFSLSLKDHDLFPFRYSNDDNDKSLFVPQKKNIHLEHHELNLYSLWPLANNLRHFYGIKAICYHPRQKQYYLIVYHRFRNSQLVSFYYGNDIELQFYSISFSNLNMSVSLPHVDSIPIVTQHDVNTNHAFYFRFGSFQNFPLLTMSTFPCHQSQFPPDYVNFFRLDNKNFQNNIQFDLRNPTSKLLVQMYYEYQKHDDSQCVFSSWIHHPIFDLELLFLLLDYISLF